MKIVILMSMFFFGEASKEDVEMVTKNLLNENWYSFDTLDILNEKDVEI